MESITVSILKEIQNMLYFKHNCTLSLEWLNILYGIEQNWAI
jgi:hypothetical protein